MKHFAEKKKQKGGYTSEILYHFVGRKDPTNHEENYLTLKKILSAGCVSYPPHTDLDSWGKTGFVIDWRKSLLTRI